MRPSDPHPREPRSRRARTPAVRGRKAEATPDPRVDSGSRLGALAAVVGDWSLEIPAIAGIYWALMRSGDVEIVRLSAALDGTVFTRIGQTRAERPEGTVVAWSGPLVPPRATR